MPQSKWIKSDPIDGFCVITGCDSSHEWMLQWWFEKYKKHNKYPVLFADFGMTDAAHRWCAAHGAVVKIDANVKHWFKKPLAILASTHKSCVWVDIDCEIRGDIGRIADFVESGVAVTLDPHTPFCPNTNPVASGVVGSKHGDVLIQEWADLCVSSTVLRGDQEALNHIIANDRSRLKIMPPEWQWLRLDGDDPRAIIMHWTGQTGKSIIRRMISESNKNSLIQTNVKKTASKTKPIVRTVSKVQPTPIKQIVRPTSKNKPLLPVKYKIGVKPLKG